MRDIIWMIDERVYGEILVHGAFVSFVRYTSKGMDYEVWVENDDFEVWKEHDYEQE